MACQETLRKTSFALQMTSHRGGSVRPSEQMRRTLRIDVIPGAAGIPACSSCTGYRTARSGSMREARRSLVSQSPDRVDPGCPSGR